MIAFALLVPLLAVPHPNSLSKTRLVVHGPRLELRMRCQVLSLLEVLDGLDANGDGAVTEDEVGGSAGPICAYLTDHYPVWVVEGEANRRRAELASFEAHFVPPRTDPIGWVFGAVDVTLELRAAEPVDALELAPTLFLATSPDHIDSTAVVWEDGTTTYFAFSAEDPTGTALRPGTEPSPDALRLGWQAARASWTDITALLVLALACPAIRPWGLVVALFLAARASAFAAGTTLPTSLDPIAPYAAAGAALVSAYLASDVALRTSRTAAPWFEALLIGALQGLALAHEAPENLVGARPSTTYFTIALGLMIPAALLLTVAAPRLRGTSTRRAVGATLAAAGLVLFWIRL